MAAKNGESQAPLNSPEIRDESIIISSVPGSFEIDTEKFFNSDRIRKALKYLNKMDYFVAPKHTETKVEV